MMLKTALRLLAPILLAVSLSACTETQLVAHVAKKIPMPNDQQKAVGHFKVGSSYKIKGRRYYPKETYSLTEKGTASWYGPGFHGKLTANGEIFDQNALTAAHRTLQLPSLVRVTNLENGKTLILRVNDRGPFAHNRILDVSQRASELLGFRHQGVARIKLSVLGPESRQLTAMAKSGRSTAGTEVALNRNGDLKQFSQLRMASVRPSKKPFQNLTTERSAVLTQNVNHQEHDRTHIHYEKPSLLTQDTQRAAPETVRITPMPTPTQKQAHLSTPRMKPIIERELYYVQVGTLADLDAAETLRVSLSPYGNARITPVVESGITVYKVHLGPVETASQAQAILGQLKANGRTGSTITVSNR